MTPVALVADTNVVSYVFRESPLGVAYMELMGDRVVGVEDQESRCNGLRESR